MKTSRKIAFSTFIILKWIFNGSSQNLGVFGAVAKMQL